MKNMTFNRDAHKENYTCIHNNILKNTALSLKAKGLMCELLALPDDWDFSKKEFTTHSTDGKDSTTSALDELEQSGYLKIDRRWINSNLRLFLIVTENPFSPESENPHLVCIPEAEIPSDHIGKTDLPLSENPQVLNTYKLNTNLLTTDSVVSSSNEEIKTCKSELSNLFESLSGFRFSEDFYDRIEKVSSENGFDCKDYFEWFLNEKKKSALNIQNYIYKSIDIPNLVEEYKISLKRQSEKAERVQMKCPVCKNILTNLDLRLHECGKCGADLSESGSEGGSNE